MNPEKRRMMGKRTTRGLIHLCWGQHCKSRLIYYSNVIAISDSNDMDFIGTSASQHYLNIRRVGQHGGKSAIPTIKPFCDTRDDAKANRGEEECCGQWGEKHFGQTCSLIISRLLSKFGHKESYHCKRIFIILKERRRRPVSFLAQWLVSRMVHQAKKQGYFTSNLT